MTRRSYLFWSLQTVKDKVRQIPKSPVSKNALKSDMVFVNTLTVDDKYSLLKRNNLMQPIQIQLSKKQKMCSHFFLIF